MRQIISRTHLTPAAGKKTFPFGIYVRKDKPLPKVGEEVVCISRGNGQKFAGEVTKVDEDHHTYDAVINLSLEATGVEA